MIERASGHVAIEARMVAESRSPLMMLPFVQVFDVVSLDGGDVALGGTDEFLVDEAVIASDRMKGVSALLCMRGGRRLETRVLDVSVRTALTGKRNVFVRVPPLSEEPAALVRAILMLPSELLD